MSIDEHAVRVTSEATLTVLSSAMVGGGLARARDIVNMHVDDVPPEACPEDELRAFAAGLGVAPDFVGMMTAAETQHAQLVAASGDGLAVAAAVSMGLSNRVCAGLTPPADAAPACAPPGTINAIVLVDADLSPAGMVNAVITATEAKGLVLRDYDVRTPDGLPAGGTSTDSVTVACTGRGSGLDYAGPATPVGWLIARAVRQAMEAICAGKIARDGGRRIGW